MSPVADLHVDLLTQDTLWIDANDVRREVSAMHPVYVRRVVAYLERMAPEIELLFSMSEVLAFDGTSESEQAMEEALDERRRDPVAWLRTMPLMRKFRDILAETQEGAPW